MSNESARFVRRRPSSRAERERADREKEAAEQAELERVEAEPGRIDQSAWLTSWRQQRRPRESAWVARRGRREGRAGGVSREEVAEEGRTEEVEEETSPQRATPTKRSA